MYTPSTKAELGDKDINISPDEARKIVGDKYAARIEELALACYQAGAEYAAERGIIIVSHPVFQGDSLSWAPRMLKKPREMTALFS